MTRYICNVTIDFEGVADESEALDEFMSYVRTDMSRRDVEVIREGAMGPGLFEPKFHGVLSEVERHPELLDLVMRQHKALSALIARQAQEYVRVALGLRERLDAERQA